MVNPLIKGEVVRIRDSAVRLMRRNWTRIPPVAEPVIWGPHHCYHRWWFTRRCWLIVFAFQLHFGWVDPTSNIETRVCLEPMFWTQLCKSVIFNGWKRHWVMLAIITWLAGNWCVGIEKELSSERGCALEENLNLGVCVVPWALFPQHVFWWCNPSF